MTLFQSWRVDRNFGVPPMGFVLRGKKFLSVGTCAFMLQEAIVESHHFLKH
jgi:hypothetical protein